MRLSVALLLASTSLLSAAPSFAVMVRGEFSGVFTESELGFEGSLGPIPEIPIGDSFTGFFEYDTEGFDFEGGIWDFGATLSWSNSVMTSVMTELAVAVTPDSFRIFLNRDTDNFDDSINGDPPWYFNYDIVIEYSEPVFFEPFSLPTEAPPVSKLDRVRLLLLGYTNNDSVDFSATGRVDTILFGVIPEPGTGSMVAMGLLGLCKLRRNREAVARFSDGRQGQSSIPRA